MSTENLCLAFIDYKMSFDSGENDGALTAIRHQAAVKRTIQI